MGKQKNNSSQAGSDRIAGRLASYILWAQRRWSDGMARLIGKLSLKSRWIIVTGFILLMSGLNIYLIIDAVTSKKKFLDSKVKIIIPALPQSPVQSGKEVLPDKVQKRISDFRASLDSLGKTTSGRRIRDSILSGRPGLADSLYRIEKLYQQLKNQ